jgi:hypothetical protein
MKGLLGSSAVLASAVASLLGFAAPASAGSANRGNARACLQDGWQKVTRSDLVPFTSEGDCVSYGARGGAILVSITLSPSSVTTTTASDDTHPTVTANFANGTTAGVTSGVIWSQNSNPAVASVTATPTLTIHPVTVGTTHLQVMYGPFTSNIMTFTVTS